MHAKCLARRPLVLLVSSAVGTSCTRLTHRPTLLDELLLCAPSPPPRQQQRELLALRSQLNLQKGEARALRAALQDAQQVLATKEEQVRGRQWQAAVAGQQGSLTDRLRQLGREQGRAA
jgi:hypothetical protein